MLQRARTMMKSILSSIRLRIEGATPRELELIRELRASCRPLEERQIKGGSSAEDTWCRVANHFRYLVATEDPRSFLKWNHLQTMVFEIEDYVAPELAHLQQAAAWTARWAPAIRESQVGHPNPFPLYPQSSGNLIHHAYHLCRFEEATGAPVASFDLVFEFGGGYGSMCRLFHNLNFKGRYVIFDFAEFSHLQRFFLQSLGLSLRSGEDLAAGLPGVCVVSDLAELRSVLPRLSATAQNSLFLATWSLSEAPLAFRQQILDLLLPFDACLLAYQDQFGEVNNESYFAQFARGKKDFRWWHLPIDHIPQQSYLIGHKTEAGYETSVADNAESLVLAQTAVDVSNKSASEVAGDSGQRVFVVIPTYNRWQEARVTLGLLLQSNYKRLTIVLVDDGCTDGTAEKCRAEFPEIEILPGGGDLWWSGAINLGTEHALAQGAELVMWLNDDVQVEANTISLLVATIERNGGKSVACARIKSKDSSAPEWRGGPPRWHPDFPLAELPELPPHADLRIEHPPGGQGVLIPAQCFREIGEVDVKKFPHYWADHDFHYRAMRVGYKYFIATEAVVWNVPNRPRPEVKREFSLRWLGWFLFDRRSAMNMPTLRRLLKRHLPPREYRKIFYPTLIRHLAWLSYGWLTGKPVLHKPLRALKKGLSKTPTPKTPTPQTPTHGSAQQ
jgi:glycosyltransferase involved in cell wall biosynthesis